MAPYAATKSAPPSTSATAGHRASKNIPTGMLPRLPARLFAFTSAPCTVSFPPSSRRACALRPQSERSIQHRWPSIDAIRKAPSTDAQCPASTGRCRKAASASSSSPDGRSSAGQRERFERFSEVSASCSIIVTAGRSAGAGAVMRLPPAISINCRRPSSGDMSSALAIKSAASPTSPVAC
jgi:hypothetical protein